MNNNILTDTFPRLLQSNYQQWGHSRIAVRKKQYGIWQEYTWEDIFEKTRLIYWALTNLGLQTGDRVAILADSSPEWLWSELAVQTARGVVVGIRSTASAEEIKHVMALSQPKIALAQDQEQVDKLLDLSESLPYLQKIVYWHERGLQHYRNPTLISLKESVRLSESQGNTPKGDFQEKIAEVTSDDVALMFIISERNSPIKLFPATHRFLISSAKAVSDLHADWSNSEYVSFLFQGWFFEHTLGFTTSLLTGQKINFPEGQDTVERDLREISPNVMVYGTQTWEQMASQIAARIGSAGRINRKLFARSLLIAHREPSLLAEKLEVRAPEEHHMGFINRTLMHPLKNKEGLGRVSAAYVAGSPVSQETNRFFSAIGINLKPIFGSIKDGIVTEPPSNDLEIK